MYLSRALVLGAERGAPPGTSDRPAQCPGPWTPGTDGTGTRSVAAQRTPNHTVSSQS